MCQEEISTHKFWCGSVQSALAFGSTLICQEGCGGNTDVFTRTFKDTNLYFVGLCCLNVPLETHYTKKVQGSGVQLSRKHVLWVCYHLVFPHVLVSQLNSVLH